MLKDKPTVVQDHKTVYDNKWFKVKQTEGGFTYGERKGVNSIAFILHSKDSKDTKPYGVTKEFKDPIDQFVTTAFGGSIDDEKYKNDLELLVKDEVVEESGFTIEDNDIRYLGKVLCSTQMNQFVHLFIVQVDKDKQGERTTTNKTELKAEIQWLTAKEVAKLEDWKAITIVSKAIEGKAV